jgi:hypothetical protein
MTTRTNRDSFARCTRTDMPSPARPRSGSRPRPPGEFPSAWSLIHDHRNRPAVRRERRRPVRSRRRRVRLADDLSASRAHHHRGRSGHRRRPREQERHVGSLKRLGDLTGDGQRFADCDRPARDSCYQRLSVDQLEDKGDDPLGFLDSEDRGDVRMIQRREDERFALEAPAALDRGVPPRAGP